MDPLSVITSVNKVALFFFVLVLGFVVYEFVMYLKENRKFEKPTVPQFNPNNIASNTFTTVVAPVKKAHTLKKSSFAFTNLHLNSDTPWRTCFILCTKYNKYASQTQR